jgi:hypothetical protein
MTGTRTAVLIHDGRATHAIAPDRSIPWPPADLDRLIWHWDDHAPRTHRTSSRPWGDVPEAIRVWIAVQADGCAVCERTWGCD